MAQWRPLHRRITSSDKVIELAGNPFALWLYTALLPQTDADGRVNGNPVGLAGTVFEGFGYTPEQIEGGLQALAEVGLIVLYRNGRHQLLVEYTKFQEMCRPDKREARSEYPGPTDEGSELITGSLPEPLPETPETTPGSLPEESAKNPRLHVHVHEHIHEQETRARETRATGARKKPEKNKPKKPLGFDPLHFPLPDFISPDVWADFVDHRKKIKKTLTDRAVELILADLAEHPLDADEMLRTSIKRGWTGVFPLDKPRDGPASDDAKEAWEQILAGARNGKMPDLDPRARTALKTIGGWAAVAYGDERGLGLLRKRYLDAYRETPTRPEKEPQPQ